jgi:hypothetical protein
VRQRASGAAAAQQRAAAAAATCARADTDAPAHTHAARINTTPRLYALITS